MPHEYGEAAVRTGSLGRDSRRAHPPPRSADPDWRVWRGEWRDAQLSGHHSRARDGAAVQLTRGAQPVAADHSAADRVSAEAGSSGAVDAVADDPGVHSSRRAEAGHGRVSRAGRRGCGRPEPLPAEPHLRGNEDGRGLQRKPRGTGTRPRLQQDPLGRRQGRRMGAVPRPHGRQRPGEQWPELHQLFRHLGAAAHAGDRGRAGRTARSDRTAAARRPRGGSRRLHRSGSG